MSDVDGDREASPDGVPSGGVITPELVRVIRSQFALDWRGIHGVPHWTRVRENGLRLAATTGAAPAVVELFAFLHDARRLHDGRDRDHGRRAAAFARELRGSHLELADGEFELLAAACAGHSAGLLTGGVTVVTCWDADRLDLGRIGTRPRPERLCTAAARDPDLIEWAYARSIRQHAR